MDSKLILALAALGGVGIYAYTQLSSVTIPPGGTINVPGGSYKNTTNGPLKYSPSSGDITNAANQLVKTIAAATGTSSGSGSGSGKAGTSAGGGSAGGSSAGNTGSGSGNANAAVDAVADSKSPTGYVDSEGNIVNKDGSDYTGSGVYADATPDASSPTGYVDSEGNAVNEDGSDYTGPDNSTDNSTNFFGDNSGDDVFGLGEGSGSPDPTDTSGTDETDYFES